MLALAAVVLSATFTSCLEPIPDDVFDEQTMVDFLTEAYQIEGFIATETGYRSELMGPEVVKAYNDLFEKFGVTDSAFEKSIDFYMRDGVRFAEIQKQVQRNLDTIAMEKAE